MSLIPKHHCSHDSTFRTETHFLKISSALPRRVTERNLGSLPAVAGSSYDLHLFSQDLCIGDVKGRREEYSVGEAQGK